MRIIPSGLNTLPDSTPRICAVGMAQLTLPARLLLPLAFSLAGVTSVWSVAVNMLLSSLQKDNMVSRMEPKSLWSHKIWTYPYPVISIPSFLHVLNIRQSLYASPGAHFNEKFKDVRNHSTYDSEYLLLFYDALKRSGSVTNILPSLPCFIGSPRMFVTRTTKLRIIRDRFPDILSCVCVCV